MMSGHGVLLKTLPNFALEVLVDIQIALFRRDKYLL